MLKVTKSQGLILIWLFVLLFASIACNFFTRRAVTPQVTVPVTTQAIEQLETEARESVEEFAQTGQFEMTITESELTSVVATELAKTESPVLTDPQILLRDGVIMATGKVQQAGLSLKAEIVLLPKIDASGAPYVELVSLSVGPFSVPESLRDQLTSNINSLVVEQLTQSDVNVRIESISIADGEMTVVGSRQP
jgi:uncharacterized protein YpmS